MIQSKRIPYELRDYLAPDNTPDRRVLASGIPEWFQQKGWDFSTFPTPNAAAITVETWVAQRAPKKHGCILWGSPGRGKTGTALAAATRAAYEGQGDRGVWNLVTHLNAEREIRLGTFRQRFAPVWFERWSDLRARLRAGAQFHARRPDDEEDDLSTQDILNEIEDRVDLLILDDIDADNLTPWKEDVLLGLIERPLRGARLLLTLNASPNDGALAAKLGERIVDRLGDTRLWGALECGGPSLRQPPPEIEESFLP